MAHPSHWQKDMTIRRLSPSDITEYRRLRLRGLRESPAALGSSYSEEVKRPAGAFVDRLRQAPGRWTMGAFDNDQLVGVLRLIREDKIKERHKASIFGMYVDRRWRRKGIGRALLKHAIEIARRLRGLKQVKLAVVEGNHPALHLYETAGFKVYGREVAALYVGGGYYSELFLVLRW